MANTGTQPMNRKIFPIALALEKGFLTLLLWMPGLLIAWFWSTFILTFFIGG
jgi:hypothetical protein